MADDGTNYTISIHTISGIYSIKYTSTFEDITKGFKTFIESIDKEKINC